MLPLLAVTTLGGVCLGLPGQLLPITLLPSRSVIMASCLFLSLARLFDFSSSSVRLVVNSAILSSNSFFSWRGWGVWGKAGQGLGVSGAQTLQLSSKYSSFRNLPPNGGART